MKPRVTYVIPQDTATGGVEVAARSFQAGEREHYIIDKYFISSNEYSVSTPYVTHGGASTLSWIPNAYAGIKWILKHRPDVLISSLWRSAAILILYKCLNRSAYCILFLHSTTTVHFIDFSLNYLAMYLSDEIWTDSSATLKHRVPRNLSNKAHVISFLTKRLEPLAPSDPRPSFIFWGRLTPLKNLSKAIKIFARIKNVRNDARFLVIGSDEGERKKLEKQVRFIGISEAVEFHGPLPFAEIQKLSQKYSFFLQTSVTEGMCMAVVEAMQLGLVPIVTPVGEIKSYCIDGKNAVIINCEDKAVNDILRVVGDTQLYLKLSSEARESWKFKPLYEQSIDNRINSIITSLPHL